MDSVLFLIVGLLVGAGIAAFGLNYYQTSQGKNRRILAEEEAQKIIAEGTAKAATVGREAEEKARLVLDEATETATRRRRELDKEDERLQRRREDVDKRYERLDQREQMLNKRQSQM